MELPDFMNVTRTFLHSGMPRYSIYTFNRLNSTFMHDMRYYEGTTNLSVLFLLGFLTSLILIESTLLIVHINLVSYNVFNITVYKTILGVFGFLAFMSAVMALVGFSVIETSLGRAIQKFVYPGKQSLETLNEHVINITDSVYGFLDKVEFVMTADEKDTGNLLLDAWNSVKNLASQNLALPLIKQAQETKKDANKLKELLAMLVWMVEFFISFQRLSFIVGVCFIFFSIVLCLWVFSCALKNGGTDPLVCRLAVLTLLAWWIIGAVVSPILIMLTDTCEEPIAVIARVMHGIVPAMDEQIVRYYLACSEPNPLRGYLDELHVTVTYVLGPLAGVAKVIGLGGSKDKASFLENANKFLAHVVESGDCKWIATRSKLVLEDVCSSFVMGLAILSMASAGIATFLSFAAMICIRLRQFKGWPKTIKKHYPCPDSCLVHKLPKPLPPSPCRPKRVEEVVKQKAVEYLRRRTCPEKCRGFDILKATVGLRETCPKTCRGLIPDPIRAVVAKPKPPKKRKAWRTADKVAVCCIEPSPVSTCVEEPEKLNKKRITKNQPPSKINPCKAKCNKNRNIVTPKDNANQPAQNPAEPVQIAKPQHESKSKKPAEKDK